MKQIFIGGMGRSGTSITLHALYRHPDVYAVPIESKIIVECDGLADLADVLTVNWSPTRDREALHRIRYILSYLSTSKGRIEAVNSPYRIAHGFQETSLDELFPDYNTKVEQFLDALAELPVVPSREIVVSVIRNLVDSLFTECARSLGKSVWAEKTPENAFRAKFLRELYPDSIFVLCERDPRGILWSHLVRGSVKATDPDSIERFAYDVLRYERSRRDIIESGRAYVLSLERFCSEPEVVLDEIAAASGLSRYSQGAKRQVMETTLNYYGTTRESMSARVSGWREKLPSDVRNTFERTYNAHG